MNEVTFESINNGNLYKTCWTSKPIHSNTYKLQKFFTTFILREVGMRKLKTTVCSRFFSELLQSISGRQELFKRYSESFLSQFFYSF